MTDGRMLLHQAGVVWAFNPAQPRSLEVEQGERHRGPTGHVHAPTGHIKGDVHRRRQADKTSNNQALADLEAPFTDDLKTLFARQESATLSRLAGKRGRRMLRRAGLRVSGQPPPPSDQQPPPLGQPPPPSAADIFDAHYWAQQLATVLAKHYQNAQQAAIDRVRDQATRGNPGAITASSSSSIGTTADILRNRANKMAADVTMTTFHDIQDQLAQGVQAGENMGQLADRVRHVFADATANRAQLIARTESHAAMNQAAQDYAQSLPKSVVARKEWLAHHDERTRPHHRLADGQVKPIDQPYAVGTSLMMFPGDPTAPPGEVCNCRCGQAFLPPEPPPLGATT
jgi:SPP1 gp7 family putative phage head morphogenesis protein